MGDPDAVLWTLHDKLKKKRLRATDLFKSIDASGDGSISAAELRAALNDMGIKLPDQEFGMLMSRIDKDGSGDVSLREFDRALNQAGRLASKKKPEKRKQGLTKDDLDEFRQIFFLCKQLCRAREQDEPNPQLVEVDETGGISADELEQLLETVGLKLQKKEIDQIVREIDIDGNGEIDFQEFCNSMTSKIHVNHSPDTVAKAFKAFARSAPDGLIRVKDLKNAMMTYMYRDLTEDQVDELLLDYQDTFITIPGHEEKYFNYQAFVDLMSFEGP